MLSALRDEIIVRPVFEKQKGLIEIPESAQEYKQYHGFVYGIVMAIGKGYPYGELKIGDRILFQRHEGKKVYIKGELFLVLKERWVHAKVIE